MARLSPFCCRLLSFRLVHSVFRGFASDRLPPIVVFESHLLLEQDGADDKSLAAASRTSRPNFEKPMAYGKQAKT
jgi:hypothetical protein